MLLLDNFPFYKQHDASDCGASCLRMVARHYGRHYSLEYLRDLTYLDRQGVTMIGLSDAAERIGMRTLGAKVGFARLKKDLPLPLIAHWEQNHFVVVYRIANGRVWVVPGKLPAKVIVAPNSPSALANPSMAPATMAGPRMGTVTNLMVCQRLAPNVAAA